MADLRARTWVAVLWTDSLNKNFESEMEQLAIPGFVSPIHSADELDTKPHIHVMFMYDNPTTYSNALDDFNRLGVVNTCKNVRSVVGMTRYLRHLDQPNKQQFGDDEQVREFCGADYNEVISMPKDHVLNIYKIFDMIDNGHICSWKMFVRVLRVKSPGLLADLLRNTASLLAIKEYISETYKELHPNEVISDD